ncbi:MAG: hypothetical protein IPJ77_03110 [Planctomycetes bacterium]|nr:hypothetical protein [Planctomycetota bacterium]
MKEIADRRAELATLSPGTRLAYSLFLVFSLASYVVMAVLSVQRSGWTPDSVSRYYLGGGDAYGKTAGELLEVTHFHLFSMPMFLFVQGHVFLMSRFPARWKRALVCAAFLGAALDLAAPWLVLAYGPGFAWTKLAARALLGPTLVLFAVVPLREMLFGGRRAAAGN